MNAWTHLGLYKKSETVLLQMVRLEKAAALKADPYYYTHAPAIMNYTSVSLYKEHAPQDNFVMCSW